MRSRVLRNDSFRLLPFFLLTSALITSLAMGVLVLEAQRGSSLAAGEVLFLVGWIGTAIFLMAGRVRHGPPAWTWCSPSPPAPCG